MKMIKSVVVVGVLLLVNIPKVKSNPLAILEARQELERLKVLTAEHKNDKKKATKAYKDIRKATKKQKKVLKALIALDKLKQDAHKSSVDAALNPRYPYYPDDSHGYGEAKLVKLKG